MRWARRAIEAWRSYWFGEISAYPIALFRILTGLYLLVYFGRFFPWVSRLFSNQGIYAPFLIPDIAPSPFWAWLIYLATLAFAAAFMLGVRRRLVNPVLLILFAYHYFLSLGASNTTYDRLTMIFLAIVAFADTNRVWSVEGGWSSPKHGAATVPAWATRLLQFQIAIFFLGSGLWKLYSPYWHRGEMMEMTLASIWATPLAFWVLSLEPPRWVFTGLTWSVVGFELVLGPMLYFRPTRKFAIAGGMGFNLSIWIFLGIWGFLNCLPAYLLFLDPHAIRTYGARIARRAATALNLPGMR